MKVFSAQDIAEKLDGKDTKATTYEVTIEPGKGSMPHRHPVTARPPGEREPRASGGPTTHANRQSGAPTSAGGCVETDAPPITSSLPDAGRTARMSRETVSRSSHSRSS